MQCFPNAHVCVCVLITVQKESMQSSSNVDREEETKISWKKARGSVQNLQMQKLDSPLMQPFIFGRSANFPLQHLEIISAEETLWTLPMPVLPCTIKSLYVQSRQVALFVPPPLVLRGIDRGCPVPTRPMSLKLPREKAKKVILSSQVPAYLHPPRKPIDSPCLEKLLEWTKLFVWAKTRFMWVALGGTAVAQWGNAGLYNPCSHAKDSPSTPSTEL